MGLLSISNMFQPDIIAIIAIASSTFSYIMAQKVLHRLQLKNITATLLLGLCLFFSASLFTSALPYLTTPYIPLANILRWCGLGILAFSFAKLLLYNLPAINSKFEEKHKLIKQLNQHVFSLEKKNTELTQNQNSFKANIDTQTNSGQYLKKSNSNDLYRNIFDQSPIFYIALSNDYNIIDINDFACKRLHYSFEKIIDIQFIELVKPEERQRINQILQAMHSAPNENIEFETQLLDNNNKLITITARLHNIQKDEETKSFLFCQDVSESRALSESLAFQATHDDLTQLFNRRALESFFEKKINNQKRETQVSIIYFDVDQLKVVNDTCGHTAGDQLLKQIVAILKKICDKHAALFTRIGGDEFTVVLVNRNEKHAIIFAEALRNAVEDFTFSWDGKSFRQTISVGVASSLSVNCSLKDLLSAADTACYTAKENGRNQVHVHSINDTNTRQNHHNDMQWVARLNSAIKYGNFQLIFQPIALLDAPASSYMHYEILLQYIDENGKRIAPGNFLPSAERFGKSTDIDLWVLTETFDFLQKNPEHTQRLDCCSINLTSHSIANFRSRSAIIALMKAYNFPPGKICFEITETSAISNLPEAIEFIQTLRALGCKFALDDFGTGFSSFGYLKNLDVDYLKIDGSFVRDIVDDNLDKAMIKAISDIAREMNIKTIAEYVENDKILHELKKVNVDMGQGFGIAKPMPIESINEYYSKK